MSIRALLALLFLPTLAQAAPYIWHFHALSQQISAPKAAAIKTKTGRAPRTLAQRLKPATQAALRGVAYLNNASGFIVEDDGNGKALLLTNEHVVRNGLSSGYGFFLFDATLAHVSRVVATNEHLDYALVEITLPPGPSRTMKLEPNGLHARRPIYSIAGYANLAFKDGSGNLNEHTVRNAVHGLPEVLRQIAAGKTNQYAIALGRVYDDASPRTIEASGHTIDGVESNLPNSPGMSGSPVLARDTHAVLALHSSGEYGVMSPWEETSIPIGAILSDLHGKLSAGALDAAAADRVGNFLKTAPAP